MKNCRMFQGGSLFRGKRLVWDMGEAPESGNILSDVLIAGVPAQLDLLPVEKEEVIRISKVIENGDIDPKFKPAIDKFREAKTRYELGFDPKKDSSDPRVLQPIYRDNDPNKGILKYKTRSGVDANSVQITLHQRNLERLRLLQIRAVGFLKQIVKIRLQKPKNPDLDAFHDASSVFEAHLEDPADFTPHLKGAPQKLREGTHVEQVMIGEDQERKALLETHLDKWNKGNLGKLLTPSTARSFQDHLEISLVPQVRSAIKWMPTLIERISPSIDRPAIEGLTPELAQVLNVTSGTLQKSLDEYQAASQDTTPDRNKKLYAAYQKLVAAYEVYKNGVNGLTDVIVQQGNSRLASIGLDPSSEQFKKQQEANLRIIAQTYGLGAKITFNPRFQGFPPEPTLESIPFQKKKSAVKEPPAAKPAPAQKSPPLREEGIVKPEIVAGAVSQGKGPIEAAPLESQPPKQPEREITEEMMKDPLYGNFSNYLARKALHGGIEKLWKAVERQKLSVPSRVFLGVSALHSNALKLEGKDIELLKGTRNDKQAQEARNLFFDYVVVKNEFDALPKQQSPERAIDSGARMNLYAGMEALIKDPSQLSGDSAIFKEARQLLSTESSARMALCGVVPSLGKLAKDKLSAPNAAKVLDEITAAEQDVAKLQAMEIQPNADVKALASNAFALYKKVSILRGVIFSGDMSLLNRLGTAPDALQTPKAEAPAASTLSDKDARLNLYAGMEEIVKNPKKFSEQSPQISEAHGLLKANAAARMALYGVVPPLGKLAKDKLSNNKFAKIADAITAAEQSAAKLQALETQPNVNAEVLAKSAIFLYWNVNVLRNTIFSGDVSLLSQLKTVPEVPKPVEGAPAAPVARPPVRPAPPVVLPAEKPAAPVLPASPSSPATSPAQPSAPKQAPPPAPVNPPSVSPPIPDQQVNSPKELARAAYKAAEALLKVGDYSGALAGYKDAEAAYPIPATKYKIAFCKDKQGTKAGYNIDAVVKAYQDFLDASPNPVKMKSAIAEVNARLAVLKKRQADAKAQAPSPVVPQPLPAPLSPSLPQAPVAAEPLKKPTPASNLDPKLRIQQLDTVTQAMQAGRHSDALAILTTLAQQENTPGIQLKIIDCTEKTLQPNDPKSTQKLIDAYQTFLGLPGMKSPTDTAFVQKRLGELTDKLKEQSKSTINSDKKIMAALAKLTKQSSLPAIQQAFGLGSVDMKNMKRDHDLNDDDFRKFLPEIINDFQLLPIDASAEQKVTTIARAIHDAKEKFRDSYNGKPISPAEVEILLSAFKRLPQKQRAEYTASSFSIDTHLEGYLDQTTLMQKKFKDKDRDPRKKISNALANMEEERKDFAIIPEVIDQDGKARFIVIYKYNGLPRFYLGQ